MKQAVQDPIGEARSPAQAPNVTVIIPVYRAEAFLAQCLDSVLAQEDVSWEAVCIDDGSPDGSGAILDAYAARDGRFRVYHNENHGAAYSRNQAMDLARGDFLFFLDSDDWLPDGRVLHDLYRGAVDHHVSVCGGSFSSYSKERIVTKWKGNQKYYIFHGDRLRWYSDYQFDYGWVRFVYDRRFLLDNDLRTPLYSFFEDPVFFVRVMDKAQTFYALERTSYVYRENYKVRRFSYENVLDLLRAITEILTLAQERGYAFLEALAIFRIREDYAAPIIEYLRRPEAENGELRALLEELDRRIYPNGEGRLEYDMYASQLSRAISQRNNKNKQLRKLKAQNQSLHGSNSWRVGRLVTLPVRAAKRLLFGKDRRSRI